VQTGALPIFSQTNDFRDIYLSTGISTSTTRLSLQKNVFLNININVYGDTLQEYVCTYVSYRPLPLRSTYRVGFRNIKMHAACFYILLYEKVLAPLCASML